MPECRHFWVSGKVQGVFFRASTREQAVRLQLTGWVRNLSDGRVEVYACGEPAQLTVLERWLQHGPEMAEVDSLKVTAEDYTEYTGFRIQPDAGFE
jgi:acylphosphatase